MTALLAILLAAAAVCLPRADCACAGKYLRHSAGHTACLPANSSCEVARSGVDDQDKATILDELNKYRDYVASGRETRAGGMPKAANMMQMVWDDELAAVAQAWADQCNYGHDKMRDVPNFPVGQNVGQEWCTYCRDLPETMAPDWPSFIANLNKEMEVFDGRHVVSYKFATSYGHVTQNLWAEAWRVGCGFVVFKSGNHPVKWSRYYVCNYGPTGNVLEEKMYEPGEPCSDCPENASCSKSYPALCLMEDENTAPKYKKKSPAKAFFYCDFSKSNGDCSTSVSGSHKWKTEHTLGGSVIEAVLSGGESSTLAFDTKLRPSQDEFCVVFHLRGGPNQAGQKATGAATVRIASESGSSIGPMALNGLGTKFSTYFLDLSWRGEDETKLELSVTFSVPRGSSEQFLAFRNIEASNGRCGHA